MTFKQPPLYPYKPTKKFFLCLAAGLIFLVLVYRHFKPDTFFLALGLDVPQSAIVSHQRIELFFPAHPAKATAGGFWVNDRRQRKHQCDSLRDEMTGLVWFVVTMFYNY